MYCVMVLWYSRDVMDHYEGNVIVKRFLNYSMLLLVEGKAPLGWFKPAQDLRAAPCSSTPMVSCNLVCLNTLTYSFF